MPLQVRKADEETAGALRSRCRRCPYLYEYKVLVTNKTTSGATALYFHHGRGSQEALIGEAKDACALGYVPPRRRVANQFFCTASLLAHNLGRELQMYIVCRCFCSVLLRQQRGHPHSPQRSRRTGMRPDSKNRMR